MYICKKLKFILACLFLGIVIFFSPLHQSYAHETYNLLLKIHFNTNNAWGSMSLPLLFLDREIDLDADRDNVINPKEVRANEKNIKNYVLSKLKISSDSKPCRFSNFKKSMIGRVATTTSLVRSPRSSGGTPSR